MGSFRFFLGNIIEYVIIEDSPVNFTEHCHSSVNVITYVVSGNVRLSGKSSSQLLGAGEYFTVKPYERHSMTSTGNVTTVTMCISRRLTEQDSEFSEKIIRRSLESFSEHISGENFPENITEIFRKKALELCGRGKIPVKADPLILRSIHEIESSPQREERVEIFAEKAYVSRYHFIRKFREAAGLTPHKFRIQSRVRMAQRLLAAGREIADTAQSSGFYDQSHFNRLFKRTVGISPGEYMRSVRNFVQD